MSEQPSPAPSVVRGVRRIAIIAIIASLAVAALLGIIALLSGEFGELQARVLGTTLTVAAFGTTALCHLAVIARRVRVVGFVGIAASIIAALCALVLIWGDLPWEQTDGIWKGLFLGAIAALSLAQINLLLLLSGRSHAVIRVTLIVTIAAIAVVAVLIALPIVTDGEIPGRGAEESYWRFFGVVAILDALGTIALPILGLVLRGTVAAAPSASGEVLVVTVPAPVAEHLRALAAQEGRSADDVAVRILTASTNAPVPPQP